MAAISNVPQLVDKKGGSYSVVAPRLEPGKFNKWKKRMLCYLTGMEPYYIQCIKDDPFKPKTVEGANKPEAQWTLDEGRVVNQDQRLKSIIVSCLPDDIIEAKFFETLSQTYTRYKTLLNELANDGVTLSKHEINVEGLSMKTTSSLEDTQIQKGPNYYSLRLSHINCLLNNIVKGFQENFDDEADERTSEEYLRDLDIEFHERALLVNSKRFIKSKNNFLEANQDTKCYKCGNKGHFARDCLSKSSEPSYKLPTSYSSSVLKGFQPKFTLKLIQSSQHAQSSHGEPKAQKGYKTEYKKLKAKLALLEASPPTSQFLKPFQPKKKGLVAETFDWDEEEVSVDEEET
ncbi:retrovirus-related pol polyprotein from transposon TNT 1-94 [Tanacetum coccineum]